MPSIEPRISEAHRLILLRLARASIDQGLRHGHALQIDPAEFDPELQQQRACFVTLNKAGQLRGCIGHLDAIKPLVADVAENAFNAAFRDPRFPPLNTTEFDAIEIHISVLSPSEPLNFDSQDDLLNKIRPGIDGLILEDGPYRGTFLPSVWEQLPDATSFLRHLKQKAGLPADYWSNSLRVWRYTTESFSDKQ